jgi:phosphoribosylaminoimidazole-succinocarboxamide synthase
VTPPPGAAATPSQGAAPPPPPGGGDGPGGPLKLLYSGKVRDVYQLPGGHLLLVATDRISAYDYVLPTPIPDKGKILTQLSLWWFGRLADLVPNHLVDAPIPAEFAGRATACQQLSMIGVECVARGYLAGSGWHDYQRTGAVCGVALPPGLTEGDRLPEPVFTPATKAPRGQHDENIPLASVAGLVGAGAAAELERITLEVYRRGAAIAARSGIIVADTKIELGYDPQGRLLLADEVLTPDSSRFWPAGQWRPGRPQPSFDKQFVRDWLDSPEAGWGRHQGAAHPEAGHGAPPPELPGWVVDRTRALYIEAYERITGDRWA